MSHTSAGWVHGELGSSETDATMFYVRSAKQSPIDVMTEGPDIAVVFATEDDARLIAAAPDMLEALEYLVAESDPDMDEDYNPHAMPLAKARNAIKRAKGE